jgi:acyl carrier protein
MGLDSVELVMEAEDAFGIKITDPEAVAVVTVGDLHRLVLDKIQGARREHCLTANAFYRLRHALMALTGSSRKDVRPQALVEGFLPNERLWRSWKRLEKQLGLALPALRLPPSLVRAIWVAYTIALAGLLWIVPWSDAAREQALIARIMAFSLLAIGLAGVWWTLAYVVMLPWRPMIPAAYSTVGGLAKQVVGRNYARLSREVHKGNEEDVWVVLAAMVAEQLDVPLERVTPEARFVRDLGMR